MFIADSDLYVSSREAERVRVIQWIQSTVFTIYPSEFSLYSLTREPLLAYSIHAHPLELMLCAGCVWNYVPVFLKFTHIVGVALFTGLHCDCFTCIALFVMFVRLLYHPHNRWLFHYTYVTSKITLHSTRKITASWTLHAHNSRDDLVVCVCVPA